MKLFLFSFLLTFLVLNFVASAPTNTSPKSSVTPFEGTPLDVNSEKTKDTVKRALQQYNFQLRSLYTSQLVSIDRALALATNCGCERFYVTLIENSNCGHAEDNCNAKPKKDGRIVKIYIDVSFGKEFKFSNFEDHSQHGHN